MTQPLLSVNQALECILSTVDPLGTETVPLEEAAGRVLTAAIHAPHNLPPFSSSSMDGFAVRAQDLAGLAGGPVTLPVSGEVAAAKIQPPPLEPGTAVRIMTGAPVPDGSDLVVPVEATSRPEAMAGQGLPSEITIHQAGKAGDFIRPAGLDLTQGEEFMAAGHFLGAAEIGLLAALGIAQVEVNLQPLVAVLSTGDELLPLEAELTPGGIRDANSYALAAAVARVGGRALRLGIAGDTKQDFQAALERAVEAGAGLLISSGGVSMGAYDVVRDVIESQGQVDFWRVNLRPGKPILYGHYRSQPFFGLPGNPVSALVTFEIFVAPVIARLGGEKAIRRAALKVKAGHDIETDGRESYFRATICWEGDQPWADLTGNQDSAVLSSLVRANALLIIPANSHTIRRGQTLTAWLLDGKILTC